jgi:NAD(P) transhydrogenase subunit alpha
MSVMVVILASLNVFGGFVVTERMLQMFKPRATPGVTAGQNGSKQ